MSLASQTDSPAPRLVWLAEQNLTDSQGSESVTVFRSSGSQTINANDKKTVLISQHCIQQLTKLKQQASVSVRRTRDPVLISQGSGFEDLHIFRDTWLMEQLCVYTDIMWLVEELTASVELALFLLRKSYKYIFLSHNSNSYFSIIQNCEI